MISSTSTFYLLGLAGTGIFLLITGWASFTHRRAARRYSAYMAQMPKAVEYDHLDVLVQERRAEWEDLTKQAAGAEELIHRKREAERWLQENEARLVQIRIDEERRNQLRVELQEILKQLDERRVEFGKYKVALEALEQKIKQLEAVKEEAMSRVEAVQRAAEEKEHTVHAELEAVREKARQEAQEIREVVRGVEVEEAEPRSRRRDCSMRTGENG